MRLTTKKQASTTLSNRIDSLEEKRMAAEATVGEQLGARAGAVLQKLSDSSGAELPGPARGVLGLEGGNPFVPSCRLFPVECFECSRSSVGACCLFSLLWD